MAAEKMSSLQGSVAIERTKSEMLADVSHEEASTGVRNASEILIDPALEKKVLRRLDKRFAPLFCALYFFGKS